MSSVVGTSEYLAQVAGDLAQITTTPDPEAFVGAYLGQHVVGDDGSNRRRTWRSASITVFPVTRMRPSGTPSRRRLVAARSVGGKWSAARAPIRRRLPSSGNGW